MPFDLVVDELVGLPVFFECGEDDGQVGLESRRGEFEGQGVLADCREDHGLVVPDFNGAVLEGQTVFLKN